MTPYDTIYNRFLASVSDYKLARLDVIDLESNLELWLNKAIAHYTNPSKSIAERDDISKAFSGDLNDTEIEAIVKYMVMTYVDTYLMREEYLGEALVSKDYRQFSPANKIKELGSLKESIRKEAVSLVSKNSYRAESIVDLFRKRDKLL